MTPRYPKETLTARLFVVGILGASVLSLTGPLALSPALADGGGDIGLDIAGTWLTDPLPAPPWAPHGQQILMTINADGTLQTTWSFEWGPYGLYGNSILHGAWTQTGPLETASRELCFIYTQNGEPEYIALFSNIYTFSEDFKTFTIDFYEEWFLMDQDPTDPDEEPVASYGPVLFTGRRLDPPVDGADRRVHASGLVDAPRPADLGAQRQESGDTPDGLNLRIVGTVTGIPTVELGLPEPSGVRLDVFDVSGRQVRSLCDELLAAGTHTFVWDGRTTAGDATGAGIYFVKLQALDQTRTAKFVRSR